MIWLGRGRSLLSRMWCHERSVAPELAEIMGIREALNWVKQKRWLNAIHNKMIMHSPFGLVVDECRKMFECTSEISFLFVYRFANSLAYSLVRASCSYPE